MKLDEILLFCPERSHTQKLASSYEPLDAYVRIAREKYSRLKFLIPYSIMRLHVARTATFVDRKGFGDDGTDDVRFGRGLA